MEKQEKEEIRQSAEQKAMEAVNRIFGNMIRESQAAYKYYEDKKTRDMYFYTIHKIKHGEGIYYVAGIYRHYKTKNVWKIVKKVGFAKKRKAKNWAYNQYKKAVEKYEQNRNSSNAIIE